MSAPLDLAAVKARCAALKHDSGAWYSDDICGIVWAGPQTIADGRVCDIRGWGHLTGRGALGLDEATATAEMDARQDFIAHSRTDVPALVAEVDRLSAEVERRERIIDAERNMQANLVAEGTRLAAENARLRSVRDADIANALDDVRDSIEPFMFCIDAQRWIANKVAALRAAGGG